MNEIEMEKLKIKFQKYLRFQKSEEYDEKYKFDFFENNQVNFLDYVDDFEEKFKEIRKKSSNLVPRKLRDYLLPVLWNEAKDDFVRIFEYLYDEDIEISKRINFFEKELYEAMKKTSRKNLDFAKLSFWETSFLLALFNYKKYIFINPVTPFNKFIEDFSLDKNLYKKWTHWERYKNWLDLSKNILIPELSKIKKDISILGIQDFIFCTFWWYKDTKDDFGIWLKNSNNATKFVFWTLVESQKNNRVDENGFVNRKVLAHKFEKVAIWKNQNISQVFSQNFAKKRKKHLFLQKIVEVLPENAEIWEEKTHYKIKEEYLDFLYENLDKLKNGDNLLWSINYWLYAPWEQAINWKREKEWNYISIWWKELGDISQYKNKKELSKKYVEIYWKKSDSNILANYDFSKNIKIGDIIFVKQGIQKLLWYWVVTSKYFYDENEQEHKSKIQVERKKIQDVSLEDIEDIWIKSLVQKTLTDISPYPDLVQYLLDKFQKNNNQILMTTKFKTETQMLDAKKQIILYWPPWTGKTYNIKNIIKEHSWWENYEDLQKSWRVEFITFHQSFSYEEFIEGIKPDLDDWEWEIRYKVEAWIFKSISKKAEKKEVKNFDEAYNKLLKIIEETEYWILVLKTKTWKEFWISVNTRFNLNLHTWKELNKQWVLTKGNLKLELEKWEKVFEYWESYFEWVKNILIKKCNFKIIEKIEKPKNYYLIIDEINRWNISKIFGELITLLEADKRIWGENEITTKLPYSKEEFGVPENLFIVATMNTSDKSIVSLDTALRRRFGFIEMLPNYSLEELQKEIVWIKLSILLKKLNNRIEYLLDKDHLIGHSYFMKLQNISDLKTVFLNEIYPLLEEYFYGEEEKVRMVLWKGFFKKKELDKNLFEKSSDFEVENVWYEVKKNISDEEFIEALKGIVEE